MPRAAFVAALLVLTGCGEEKESSRTPPASTAPAPRLLVVGWDGATFRAIDPLLAAGRLPHLAALLARGTRAELESTVVPISSAAWTVLTTGKGPGETGVFGFHAPRAGSYELELVSARSIRAAPLWRLLSGRGVPSFVFGVPLTYPPEPILGTLVCGMLAPPAADYAWPSGLAQRLRARGFLPDIDPWLEQREPTRAEALAQLDLREEILAELLVERDWGLAWIVFKELDVLAHFSLGEDLTEFVTPLYERLDALLGRLVTLAGPEANVIVLSDHGFASYGRGFNLHAWLAQEGFARRRADARDEPLPTGPFARVFAEEAAQRLAELELEATQATAYTCEGSFGSLRLNLRGREPQGAVAPEEASSVLARIEARLRAHPWVVRTWRAEELLPGPERAALPDLLFETLPDVQVFAERGTEVQGDYVSRVADHDRMGIFAAAGPAFTSGRMERSLALLDVAPLAMHLLGEPVPEEMRGTIPTEILRAPRKVERLPEASFPILFAPRSGPVYTPEEVSALEQGLRALGYGD